MTDPITDRVAQILAADQEIFVPLLRLYRDLTSEGLLTYVDLNTFERLLESDRRFEFIEDLEEEIIGDLLDPRIDAELEAMGFFGGPRVKLRAREVSTPVLMDSLLRQLQTMNSSLENAWRTRADDPEIEGALLQMLMMGDMLERQVREMLQAELTLSHYFGGLEQSE
jgi:hypothetical protein